MNNDIILPGATIGVFGNGQLGQMFAKAAKPLGYNVRFYSNVPGCADSFGSAPSIIAPYNDRARLEQFAQSCDIATFEFENVPTTVFETFRQFRKGIYPSQECLATSQDRRKEKALARELGIPTPAYWVIESEQSLEQTIIYPAILKTATDGYDGRGQRRVRNRTELHAAWTAFEKRPCVAEAIVNFFFECSVILARNQCGEVQIYEPFNNTHKGGILHETVWPIPKRPGSVDLEPAKHYARKIAKRLDLVGLLTVEFFVTVGGEIIFNEIAPRPHNSGHITIDCSETSQFEQHVRAICCLPFHPVKPTHYGKMTNAIGETSSFARSAGDENVFIHDYGKEPRPGRKVGHITRRLGPFVDE